MQKLYIFFCPHGRFILKKYIPKYVFYFLFFLSCQVEHLHNFILFRFSMGFIDNIIAKCKYALKEMVEWDWWKKWSVVDIFKP